MSDTFARLSVANADQDLLNFISQTPDKEGFSVALPL